MMTDKQCVAKLKKFVTKELKKRGVDIDEAEFYTDRVTDDTYCWVFDVPSLGLKCSAMVDRETREVGMATTVMR